MRRRPLAAALELGLALLIAAAASEAYLRLFDRQTLITPWPDEVNGIGFKAKDCRVRDVTGDYDAVYRFNSLGFRGREYSLAKPPGVYRVAALGSSMTLGFGVPDDQTFEAQLEGLLDARGGGRRFEALNFGLQAYYTSGLEPLYRERIRLFQPDAVVVALMPFPALTSETAVKKASFQDAGRSARLRWRLRSALRRVPGYAFLCERSQLFSLLRRRAADAFFPEEPWLGAAPAPGMTAAWKAMFASFVDAVEGSGPRPRLVVLRAWDPSRPPAFASSLEELAASDPRIELLTPAVRWPQDFFANGHWNAEGHRIVAEQLAAAILRPDDERGRTVKHAALLESLLKEHPSSLYYKELASDELALGRLALAHADFAKAKALDGRDTDAYIQEGYARLNEGDDAAAEKDFARITKQDPGSSAGYQHLGTFLDNEGRLAEAEADLNRALALEQAAWTADASSSDARMGELAHTTHWLAHVLREEGKLPRAEAALDLGLSRTSLADPERTPWAASLRALLLSSKASILAAEGRKPEAEALFQAAASQCRRWNCWDGFKAGILADEADFLADAGRRPQALADADAAASLFARLPAQMHWGAGKEIFSYHDLGAVYVKLGENAKAERYFRGVIERRRSMPFNLELAQAEAGLAALCARDGRRTEARALYKDADRIWRRHGLLKRASSGLLGIEGP